MSDVTLLPPLLICERTGRWADALRAAFARRRLSPPIVETRSPAELQATVVERRRNDLPGGPTVFELTAADAERTCLAAAWHVQHGDDVPLAIVTVDGHAYEATARAAGATLFAASLRTVDPIVELYVAFAVDAANRCVVPRDDARSAAQMVWDALPWPTN